MTTKAAFEESFNLLCGDCLGYGMSRQVFVCALLPGYVVKVETDAHRFQNVLEWETWQTVCLAPPARWFAACKWLSPNGKLLIQERTRPPSDTELLAEIPLWFTDLKVTNWGMARREDGSEALVCHDYGTSLCLQEGTTTKRLRKAEWIRDDR